MPRPTRPRGPRPDLPDERQASRLPAPRLAARRLTPAQLAKASVAKRPSPPGMPDKAEILLRLALHRAALERLTARAIAQGRKLEALAQELLEAAAEADEE